MRAAITEQQLGEIAVAWLEELGAEVYQEVQVPGGVADIVAKLRAEVWIVEVKTSLSLALIAQAANRRRLAHRVCVAAPRTRNMREVLPLLEELGIGFLEIVPTETCGRFAAAPRVLERLRARRCTSKPVPLSRALHRGHQTHAKAGAVGARGRWTPFRDTCEQLARVVEAEPGITMKAAINKVDHHYASSRSAVSSLAHWCEKGKVAGVRLARSHGTHGALVLFPDGGAA